MQWVWPPSPPVITITGAIPVLCPGTGDWGTVPDACFIILTSMGVAAPESLGCRHLLSARPSMCTWWAVQRPVILKFKEKPDAKWSCRLG